MYLEIFLADFAAFCVFWGISRDFAGMPEFRWSATARNIRRPAQRSFESLFQHVKHCMTIFLSMTSAMCNFTANSNTHVCKFGWTKFDTHTVLISLFILLQVLLSSWCSKWKVQLYFPCDLALNFRVAKNFFNNFFVTWAQKEFAYLL